MALCDVQLCVLALMAALALALLVQAFRMACRDVGHDFTSYLLAAQALLRPQSLSSAIPFPLPLSRSPWPSPWCR